jgi:peroxiredoxin
MTTSLFTAGTPFPSLDWPAVGGGRVKPATGEGWRLLVIYRGKHCPLCKMYLATLNEMLGEFKSANIDVSVLSTDSLQKASTEAKECGWEFPVGYDLTVEEARQLGLYVSSPRSPQETDQPFAEPGLFVINPKGQVQIVDVSNAPFARPDLKSLLGGIRFVIEKDYPVRGTA